MAIIVPDMIFSQDRYQGTSGGWEINHAKLSKGFSVLSFGGGKNQGKTLILFLLRVTGQMTQRSRQILCPVVLFLLLGNLVISPVLPSHAETLTSSFLANYDIRKGVFLIATPSLLDPSFRESVVLICEHGKEGTIGLILNKPTKYLLSEVFPDIPGLKGLSHTLFEGGPVQRQGLLMLFRSESGSENTQSVLDGVFWGGDRKMMASILENPHPDRQFRVFSGYSGWGRGQLENEIRGRFWTAIPASAEIIFKHDPETLWKELMEKSTRSKLVISYPHRPSD